MGQVVLIPGDAAVNKTYRVHSPGSLCISGKLKRLNLYIDVNNINTLNLYIKI